MSGAREAESVVAVVAVRGAAGAVRGARGGGANIAPCVASGRTAPRRNQPGVTQIVTSCAIARRSFLYDSTFARMNITTELLGPWHLFSFSFSRLGKVSRDYLQVFIRLS